MQRKDDHAKIGAETGVTLPQAKARLEPAKARKVKEGSSPGGFGGSSTLLTP